MKQITFILLFISFNAFTQNSETIRIDSLPIYGAFLEKGWTWHIGDSPDYAKADFDDSAWENIDPTKDIMELPQLPKTGEIFWLRFHQSIDSSRMQQLVMMIFQSGASEFYLNGKLIHSFGVLSKNPLEIKAFTPFYKPVS